MSGGGGWEVCCFLPVGFFVCSPNWVPELLPIIKTYQGVSLASILQPIDRGYENLKNSEKPLLGSVQDAGFEQLFLPCAWKERMETFVSDTFYFFKLPCNLNVLPLDKNKLRQERSNQVKVTQKTPSITLTGNRVF